MASRQRSYDTYIVTNKSGTLYTGMTGDIQQRVHQHKEGCIEGFAKRYNITRLLYYEVFADVHDAIAREKQIKGWVRRRKIALIESADPDWRDLNEQWHE